MIDVRDHEYGVARHDSEERDKADERADRERRASHRHCQHASHQREGSHRENQDDAASIAEGHRQQQDDSNRRHGCVREQITPGCGFARRGAGELQVDRTREFDPLVDGFARGVHETRHVGGHWIDGDNLPASCACVHDARAAFRERQSGQVP